MTTDTFPFYKQLNAMDCGAACLHMVTQYHGKYYSLSYLRDISHVTVEGVSLKGISIAAEQLGLRTLAANVSYEQLVEHLPLPLIAHWRNDHFVVVYKADHNSVHLADPSHGKIKLSKEEFLDGFLRITSPGTGQTEQQSPDQGIVLVLEKTSDFGINEEVNTSKAGFSYVMKYFFAYPKLVFQLCIGLFLSGLLALAFPFLIQLIVDEGLGSGDKNFIFFVAGVWLVLLLVRVGVEYIRSGILLHIGVRTNIQLISDYLAKMLHLPLKFFDKQLTSDLLQRIYDNDRVSKLLTTSSILSLFDAITVLLLSVVLAFFNWKIFVVFAAFTVLYVVWLSSTTKKRKELDYKRFDKTTDNNHKLLELIQGMQEIKLHNAEQQRRWAWERTEAQLYYLGIKYLQLNQKQHAVALFLNEAKNIILILLSAILVLNGEITLGMLVAIMYILSMISIPLHQLVKFTQSIQEAKVNLERMNEIHKRKDEENPALKTDNIPKMADLSFQNVTFQYEGGQSKPVLEGISCSIPHNKVTAIVGGSGSGKTTMLKLMLNFYQPQAGFVKIGEVPIMNILNSLWRSKCAAVLQDGYLFGESIAQNIALGRDDIDNDLLYEAAEKANILEFVESLSLGFNTKVGINGIGLSQGQKQRLLLARAIYKQPEYLFLDEATNALDAHNESLIMDNLIEFFRERTVVIIAHRLSTVRQADHIIVLKDGGIVEQGSHEELVLRGTMYFELIRQQLS